MQVKRNQCVLPEESSNLLGVEWLPGDTIVDEAAALGKETESTWDDLAKSLRNQLNRRINTFKKIEEKLEKDEVKRKKHEAKKKAKGKGKRKQDDETGNKKRRK
eukprot:TRINITY_DN7457_c0_g1_i1.p1 TRINITY_DN7457_c0_g1~~TRINITY_DN7457_c0_g1_i1.p1  ORF type:complete len:104 (-),score=24.23 TRINITY_DN7457_c0_g1_i1:233-544(-)